MSRIEKALELAAQMRTGAPQAAPQTAPQAAPQAAPAEKVALAARQGSSRTVTINAGNRLLATVSDPHSAVSEQFRKLKSRVLQQTKGDRLRNILMVTSASTGEGKSLTATNLAISLAQEYDLTVLLVDADLRRPSIHRYLGFEQGIGLSDCLLDGIDIGDAINRTDLGKLTVLTAGREVEKPLELFASKKMQELMAEIKNRYADRYVIIDTPPLLPFAETRSLAHLVDGVVFVIREGATSKECVHEAMEVLKGCPILGVVLNESTAVSPENSYYGEYYGRQKAL